MDSKTIRRANLVALIRHFGTKSELARVAGISEAYLSQIIGARANRNVGDDLARRLERAAGKPHGWMDHDHSGSDNGNTEEGPPIRKVPVISWVQAGQWNAVDAHSEDDEAREYRFVEDRALGSAAFALRVRGDSMTNPNGFPTYPDGCLIVVDPSIAPKNRDRVVVKIDGIEDATFKQLVLDSGTPLLMPLNPRYPPMEFPSDARIVGVVVQTIIDG